jgi:hypothetical protein
MRSAAPGMAAAVDALWNTAQRKGRKVRTSPLQRSDKKRLQIRKFAPETAFHGKGRRPGMCFTG